MSQPPQHNKCDVCLELLDALKALTNETRGLLEFAGLEIANIVSLTNVNCLERRIEKALAAIAKAEGM